MSLAAAPANRRRAMALQAAGGYLNTAIVILQGLLLVPLYLRFIGPHSYGLWLATGGILGLLNVMNLGFGSLLIQRVARAYGEQDLQKAGAYFVNGMAVYLVLASAFVAAGMLVSLGLGGLLKVTGAQSEELRRCFQWAVLGSGLGLINECLRGFAQALLRPLLPVIALAVARIASVPVCVYLLHHQAGLWALPAGIVTTEVVALLLGLLQANRLFRGLSAKVAINRDMIREYLRIGGALFAARLGRALSNESDPLLIAVILRPEASAAFMVTRKAADIVFRLIAVIYASAQGTFAHQVGEGDEVKTGSMAAGLLALAFFGGLAGFASYLALNASFVALWVGAAVVPDHLTTLFIALGFFAGTLRNVVLQILNGLGSFNYTSKVAALEGAAKFGLAALFINLFGVSGAPLALTIAGGFSLFLLCKRLKARWLPTTLPVTWTRVLLGTLVAFGLAQTFACIVRPAGSRLIFFLCAGAGLITVAIFCVLLYWEFFRGFLKASHKLSRAD